MTATFAAPTLTAIVITTAVAGIDASTAFTINLSGLTMGAVNAGSATGIRVQTEQDTLASAGVDSGAIASQTTSVTLTIAAGDRVAAKPGVVITLAFTTQTALSIGGKITLTYPSGFFATSPAPSLGSTSVASMTATFAAPTTSAIVITTATTGIAANTPFTITLSGLTMGGVNAGSAGITVQTDQDTVASVGVASGAIFTQASAVLLTIAAGNRVAAKAGVPVTAGADYPIDTTLAQAAAAQIGLVFDDRYIDKLVRKYYG